MSAPKPCEKRTLCLPDDKFFKIIMKHSNAKLVLMVPAYIPG